MMTDAAAILPNGSGRQACPPRQTGQQGETVQRQPGERADVQRRNAVQDDLRASDRDRSGCEGRSDFKEALRKRVDSADSENTDNDTNSDTAETSQGAVIEAATVFQARGQGPVCLKAAATASNAGVTMRKKQSAGHEPQLNRAVFDRIGSVSLKTAQKPADTKDMNDLTRQTTARSHELFADIKANIQQRQGAFQEQDKAEKVVPQAGGKASDQPVEAAKAEKADSVQTIENSARPATEKSATTLIDTKDEPGVQRVIHTIPRAEKTDTVLRSAENAADSEKTKNDGTRFPSLKESSEQDSGKPLMDGKTSTPDIAEGKPSQTHPGQPASHTTQSVRVPESIESVTEAAPPTQTAANSTALSFEKGAAEVGAARPIDQIVQTLQLRTFGAESQVRMMLAPESLGAIRITFRQADGQVLGLLEVQKTETRKEIERSAGQLTAAMEAAGVQVRRIEVVPWTANSQQAKGDQSGQEFDAADQREMYRSAGEEPPRHSGKKAMSGPPVPGSDASEKPLYGDIDRPETGLNFYL